MNNIAHSFFSILMVVVSHSSSSILEGKWHSTKSSSYISFSTDGKFEGHDGCNEIRGTWRISNDSLILSDIFHTLIACIGPQVITEFPSSGRYTVSNDTLIINKDTLSYKYYKQISTSVSLLEGKWRSTKSSSYISFSANGKFAGHDGCNEFWGTCRITSDSLFLIDISGTLIACLGPQVITELPSSGPYIVSSDTLLIFNATQSYKYYKQVSASVTQLLQPQVIRTQHRYISSNSTVFYDITGRCIRSSPSTSTISRSSGILIRRDKNGYSIRPHLSDN